VRNSTVWGGFARSREKHGGRRGRARRRGGNVGGARAAAQGREGPLRVVPAALQRGAHPGPQAGTAMSRDRCLIPVARANSSAMMAGRNRVGAMESGFDNECGCRARRFGCAIDHFSEPSHVLSLPRFDANVHPCAALKSRVQPYGLCWLLRDGDAPQGPMVDSVQAVRGSVSRVRAAPGFLGCPVTELGVGGLMRTTPAHLGVGLLATALGIPRAGRCPIRHRVTLLGTGDPVLPTCGSRRRRAAEGPGRARRVESRRRCRWRASRRPWSR